MLFFFLPALYSLFQNVRHLYRIKFHLCSLERLSTRVINLGPGRSSQLLPTVEMIGPGTSQGMAFQGYGARKIKPRVTESGTNAAVFHSSSPSLAATQENPSNNSGSSQRQSSRAQTDCSASRGSFKACFEWNACYWHLPVHMWAPFSTQTGNPL